MMHDYFRIGGVAVDLHIMVLSHILPNLFHLLALPNHG